MSYDMLSTGHVPRERMRIVYDHQIVGSQKFGGVSRYVCELAREMATTFGQDVTVVSPLFANHYLREAPPALKVVGLPIRHIPRTGRVVLALNSILVPRIVRGLAPDLVHETYYSHRRVGPKTARVVLTVYDMIHERFPDAFPPGDATAREKALAVQRADHVVCISEQTRTDLIELLRVDPAKTSVVHLGFGLSSRTSAVKPRTTLPRPFLLYVGYRGRYKNFSRVLRAYAGSHRLREAFDIVCFGGGSFGRPELTELRELQLPIEKVRHVSGDDAVLETLYRSAAAFVYPSLYEGFGIPTLEAMSCDCPVICSSAGAIPEIVGDAGEMFDPHKVDSIQTALERVLDDPSRRQELVSRGRERIQHFSWTRCARETFDVYRRMALPKCL